MKYDEKKWARADAAPIPPSDSSVDDVCPPYYIILCDYIILYNTIILYYFTFINFPSQSVATRNRSVSSPPAVCIKFPFFRLFFNIPYFLFMKFTLSCFISFV